MGPPILVLNWADEVKAKVMRALKITVPAVSAALELHCLHIDQIAKQ